MTNPLLDGAGIPSTDEDLYGREPLPDPTASFISFRIESEWYGMRLTEARQIIHARQIAYLPSAPAHVAGIVNIRGSIVPAASIKQLFHLQPATAAEASHIIIVEVGQLQAGLLVDEIGKIIILPVSRLEPPLATLQSNHAIYIEHTCCWEGRLMAILHIKKIFEQIFHFAENLEAKGMVASA